MVIREHPTAPILYDDATGAITGMKHPNGTEMPVGTGCVMNQPYAATLTLDLSQKPVVVVGTLTGACAVANPTKLPPIGQEVSFHFQQDGTGARAVSWGTNFVFPSAWTNTGNSANTGSSVTFVSNGTKLHAKGGNAWA